MSESGYLAEVCDWKGCTSTGPLYAVSFRLGGQIEKRHFCQRCYVKFQNRARSTSGRNTGDMITRMFGSRYEDATFDSFITDKSYFEGLFKLSPQHRQLYNGRLEEMAQAKKRVQAFAQSAAKSGHGSMFLYGPEGSGKTHLHAATIRTLLEAGRTVAFRKAPSLVGEIRATYGDGIRHYRETLRGIITGILKADVVAIEDVQPVCFRDDIRNHIFEIIDSVYSKEKIFIMTSNISFEQMRHADRFGPHTMDRIAEPPSCVLKMEFPSYRALMSKIEDEHE